MDKENLVTLRAHHLLCLQGYQGYGYDERFKKNLEKKLKILKNNKTKVIVTCSPDDLCMECPNLLVKFCGGRSESPNDLMDNDKKIIEKDLIILNEIKIDPNKNYLFKDLIKIVNSVFLKRNQLKNICKNCQWTKECLWYESREIL